ncbi:MAG TPA: hypothetical protein VH985_10100 [Candidatus Binatia bacterium]|jgi:hypothetical protein
MNPLLMVAIPLVLIILGMIHNSIGLSFDQPPDHRVLFCRSGISTGVNRTTGRPIVGARNLLS